MLHTRPAIAMPLLVGWAGTVGLSGGNGVAAGGVAGGAGGTAPKAAANSGKLERDLQGPSSKRAWVWALARPSAIHCRSCSSVTGPYSFWSAPTILYMKASL